MHAGHLVVKEQAGTPGWVYYEFSSRANAFPYAISRDGERIAYAHTSKTRAGSWEESIEVANPGNHERFSLKGFQAQALSLSPNGESVAFLGVEGSTLQGWDKRGLFTWDIKSNSVSHVTANIKPMDFGTRPHTISWPETDHIVVESAGLGVLSFPLREPSKPQLLAHGEWPSVSPDGSMLVFLGAGQMRLLHLQTGNKKALFAVPLEWNSGVSWSPDSRYIAYVRPAGSSDRWRIFLMRLDDSKEFFIASVDGRTRILSLIDKAWLTRFKKEPARR